MAEQVHREEEQEFSIKSWFVPLTTLKAINWIVIIGFIVYGNMLFNGFVWDDKPYIIFNSDIFSINLLLAFGKNFFNTLDHYRPVTYLYYSFVHIGAGNTPFVYHFFQLVIHLLNASLLFFVFNRFFSKKISLILSLFFLVHPLQVESVSYIAATADPLAFFFGIYALFLSQKQYLSLKRLLIIGLLLLLASLTKESGVIFIFIFLLFRFLFQRKQYTFVLFFPFVSAIIYLCLRISTIGFSSGQYSYIPIASLSFAERLINIPKILFHYISTFFFPNNLAVSQNWIVTRINFDNFYLPFIVDCFFFLIALLIGYFSYKKSQAVLKQFIFFFLWFVIGILMIIQILPLDMTVADRWMYFPMVGVLGLIGVCLTNFHVGRKYRLFFVLIAIIIVVIFSVRTMVRNTNWKDELTLLTHDIKVQDDYNKQVALGSYLISAGQYDQALVSLKKSVKLNPFYFNMSKLAIVYERKGDIQKSKSYFRRAITLSQGVNPTFTYQIFLDYARLLTLYDDPKEASTVINQHLINNFPNNAYIWRLLAIAEYRQHNQGIALLAAEKAYQIQPNDPLNSNIFNVVKNKLPLDVNIFK